MELKSTYYVCDFCNIKKNQYVVPTEWTILNSFPKETNDPEAYKASAKSGIPILVEQEHHACKSCWHIMKRMFNALSIPYEVRKPRPGRGEEAKTVYVNNFAFIWARPYIK